MSAPKFEIYAWHAVHTSGTKFYQVIRISAMLGSSPQGSLALRQNGSIAVSNGCGKMQTGAIDGIETKESGSTSGNEKKNEKRGGGYYIDEKEANLKFDNIAELRKWINANIGPKGERYCRTAIQSLKWADLVSTGAIDEPPAHLPKAPIEPEEPAAAKHTDWGSW